MNLLKKENWFVWLILLFLSYGMSNFALASTLDVYEETPWFLKWAKNKNDLFKLLAILITLTIILLLTFYSTQITELIYESTNIFVTLTLFIASLYSSIILIAAIIAFINVSTKVAAKLNVKGSELYLSTYIWIVSLIIPILGWAVFVLMFLYVILAPIYMIYKGQGELINN